MITVPLVALLALWIFATTLTAGPALTLFSAKSLAESIADRGANMAAEVQRERRLSVQYLADPGSTTAQLNGQRQVTDRAIETFRKAARGGDAWQNASDVLRERIDQVFTELEGLASQRLHIDRRELDMIGAQNIYNSMVKNMFEMFMATATFPDEEINRQIRALATTSRGQEHLSRVDSLLAGATLSGQLSEDLRTAMVQDIGIARFLLQQGIDSLPVQARAAFEKMNAGEAFTQLNGMMDRIIDESRAGEITPVAADTWHPAYVKSAAQLRAVEDEAVHALAERGTSLAIDILIQLLLAALLGLGALLVSLMVSIRVGRSMVGRLRRLRGEASEMATERLPNVVRRLQRGENVDVDVETPPLEYGADEIGELGQAFNDVQRTAVQSAVEEANVRRGLNEVFLNIARRSQTLLHRQLALLDRMERRETEPQELEDLYRVDHLATRMRRHAEDLVILAGAAPGRGWRNPVPVIDVVRGAISEVEDYKRVDIRSVESTAVLGRAVGDVIHLLAELLENAASFSPPHTRVQVSGQVLPNGYAIEIEDRGLGMSHDAIDEANRRLVEPPEFDPADSARLGLFVVAQLANRHGIRVSLRESPFGGVTAIVLLPGELVVPGPGQAALPSGPITPDRIEQPLVGSGSVEPGRRSLAALQWQGAEELREITVAGRPVALNDGPAPVVEPVRSGPVPSSVAEGVNADGLVQRRRVRRPVDLGTADEAVAAARTAQPALPAAPASGATTDRNRRKPAIPRPRGKASVTPISAAPLFPGTLPAVSSPVAPTSAAPMFAAPTSAPPAGDAPATEDGLPRRIRQASLAPQLRQRADAPPDEPTVPMRSPEQVRSLMSALQLGTTRGRIDASRYRDDSPPADGDSPSEDRPKTEKPENGASSDDGSFADAATVSFPAIANVAVARAEAPNGAGADAAGDRTDDPEQDNATRPEKDA
ncbi:histidine kinase [Paractinoplanes rishiriensis]|uniref:histidine kinase n=2 Tax=Paractinoplanes rishiriensis TaxID=1050105 RepID=A0A919K512_9ACTN|nr:histidine kinase [Actinoplanes rishiriensis]